jgi:hypothetical protein
VGAGGGRREVLLRRDGLGKKIQDKRKKEFPVQSSQFPVSGLMNCVGFSKFLISILKTARLIRPETGNSELGTLNSILFSDLFLPKN